MLFGPAISETEIRAVQDGIANDVRSDGRSLTQRRPFTIVPNHTTGGATTEIDYDGSCVEVQCGGTTVVAAATPSVVELQECSSISAEEGEKEEVESTPHNSTAALRGPLYITIDAVPAVVDYYAESLRNRGGRYRQAYLSFLATTIRQTFGAESVVVQEQLGVAEAERIPEENANDNNTSTIPNTNSNTININNNNNNISINMNSNSTTGYPGEQLYLGSGHAFRVDVDVHVLQAGGGGLAAHIALAVHAALKALRLPAVSLHQTAAGVAVEVDRTRPFHRPINWEALPTLAILLLSPTRHYVVDPTPLEELALPQQVHIAANAAGMVAYTKLQQMPARRGNAWRLGNNKKNGRDEELSTAVSPMDLTALLHDAPYICQAIISECDEALQKTL
ncbi:exosome-associated protein 1 [Trypanosoma theileri]|uniref:Exosome-associated protein 1 n=1 Tax=Trypanosoma theileri TaxID=67003 RepID=A0A1X0NWT9_9TRYP|nr:exosome-associated protein 1 [Trypanosoma theileri]ORC88943.1 exosome-associated protein 1 [Trypanosoma theileri]